MYLALCEKAYPKKLAFAFLDELTKEFEVLHGDEVEAAERPYQFIGFGKLHVVIHHYFRNAVF